MTQEVTVFGSLMKPGAFPAFGELTLLNYNLPPGDAVLMGKLGLIYAVGAFKNQGKFPLKGTTVTQLIALADGVGYEGDTKDAHIVREVENARVAIAVDIRGILKGTEPDVELQSDDILLCPVIN